MRAAPWAAGAIVCVIVILAVVWSVVGTHGAGAVVSTPAGAPCPAVSHAALASRLQPGRLSPVGGVLFAREGGDVYCNVSGDLTQEVFGGGDTVSCEFSAPGPLSVRTKRAEFDFAPPPGQVATVIVSKGQPRCVLAAPYWAALSQSLAKDMRAGGS